MARDALAISPFNFEFHHTLGFALAQKGDFVAAADQFIYTLFLRPDLAQSAQICNSPCVSWEKRRRARRVSGSGASRGGRAG